MRFQEPENNHSFSFSFSVLDIRSTSKQIEQVVRSNGITHILLKLLCVATQLFSK